VTDFKTARGIMPNDPRVGAQTSRRLDDNLFVEPPELDPAFVHHGKILDGVTAVWPPLVTEDVFWTVQRILTDPARTTTRENRPLPVEPRRPLRRVRRVNLETSDEFRLVHPVCRRATERVLGGRRHALRARR
jgi:hypothetical protein